MATEKKKANPKPGSIDELYAHPNNPRRQKDPSARGLKRSIERFGDLSRITFNLRTNRLVSGHQRVKQLKALGAVWRSSDGVLVAPHDSTSKEENEFPVRFVDWSEEFEAEALIAANNRNIQGEYTDELESFLLGIHERISQEEFELLQFDKLAKDQKIDLLGPDEIREVEPPPPPKDPTSKTGDVWVLGNHLLMVGDSTKDVLKVVQEGSVDLVVTDPPYGVDYVGKTKDALTIKNDGKDDLRALLTGSLRDVWTASKPGAVWYVFAPAGPQFLDFATVLTELDVWRQTLVWVKDTLVLGRSDYHYQHEAIFYGWRAGKGHHAPPDRRQTTLWEFERPKKNKEHPTMKPIALIAHCMQMSSSQGDLVLDPFGGSGSTLIASEQTGRRCVTLEMDPRYADVIIQRWEESSGGSAKKKT